MQNCHIPAQILEAENDSGSISSRRWGGIHRSVDIIRNAFSTYTGKRTDVNKIHKVLKQIPGIIVELRLEKTFQHPLHKR